MEVGKTNRLPSNYQNEPSILVVAIYFDGRFNFGFNLKSQDYTETLRCAKTDCTYETCVFNELIDHYFLHDNKGHSIAHKCSDGGFRDFCDYCLQVHEKYLNIKKVSMVVLRGEGGNELHHILKEHVLQGLSFKDFLEHAVSIAEEVGSYFIFHYNSKDFLKRLLTFYRIPLQGVKLSEITLLNQNETSERNLKEVSTAVTCGSEDINDNSTSVKSKAEGISNYGMVDKNEAKDVSDYSTTVTSKANDGSNYSTAVTGDVSQDKLNNMHMRMYKALEGCKIDIENEYEVEFGLKKWPFMRGSHSAVILKFNQLDVAFRIELVFDGPNEEHNDIGGPFRCPKSDCGEETKSFRDYASHYLSHFKELKEGETITHECCCEQFDDFRDYCKHLYENHRIRNVVAVKFERVHPDKMEEFLNDNVSYFPSGIKMVRFPGLFENAMKIMTNFGRYFIFFWNCQDFATWYLTYHGIPLEEIEPTMTDKSSGSGTGSSVRWIQRMKNDRWYKDPKKVEIQFGNYASGGYSCDQEECKYLPPMNISDLQIHDKLAHNKSKKEKILHLWRNLLGTRTMFADISITEHRKFSLYRLRKDGLLSHDSIVLQPWTFEGISQKVDHYCKIHNVSLDYINSAAKFEGIREKEKSSLEHIFDFELSLENLYFLIGGRDEGQLTYLTSNCRSFTESITSSIRRRAISITNESTSTWYTWLSFLLMSLPKMHHRAGPFLPLLILISRISELMNPAISCILFIIILFDLYEMVFQIFRNGLFCISTVRSMVLLHLPPCTLLVLGYQVITNPSNVSANFIMYYSWSMLIRKQGMVNASEDMLEGVRRSKHIFRDAKHRDTYRIHLPTVGGIVKGKIFLRGMAEYLMLVSLTWNYYPFIIMYMLIVGVICLSVARRGNVTSYIRLFNIPTSLQDNLIQEILLLMYMCFAISGLYNGTGRCNFKAFTYFYMLPCLITFSELITCQRFAAVIKNTNVKERLLYSAMEAEVNGNSKYLRYCRLFSNVVNIMSYFSNPMYILPVIFTLFLFAGFVTTWSFEYFFISNVILMCTYCDLCIIFMKIAYSHWEYIRNKR